jgi:hypothetical protein
VKRSRIVRRTPLRRTAPPRPRRKRKKVDFDRIYGGVERVLWIQRQPCVITGEFPCVTVHVKGGGVSRKADYRWTVPMIPVMHDELHRIGIRSFEARYNVDLELAAIACQQAWLSYQARMG